MIPETKTQDNIDAVFASQSITQKMWEQSEDRRLLGVELNFNKLTPRQMHIIRIGQLLTRGIGIRDPPRYRSIHVVTLTKSDLMKGMQFVFTQAHSNFVINGLGNTDYYTLFIEMCVAKFNRPYPPIDYKRYDSIVEARNWTEETYLTIYEPLAETYNVTEQSAVQAFAPLYDSLTLKVTMFGKVQKGRTFWAGSPAPK